MDLVELKAKVASGDVLAGWQLALAARKQGDMATAIDTAALLGARHLLVDLASEAWDTPDLRNQAMAELGLAITTSDAERINRALTRINGNHRKDLLFVEHVLHCLVQARHADDRKARRPHHGRFYWMARRTQRGFCRATLDGDTLHLTLGTEEVESYSRPKDIAIEATLDIGAPDLPERPRIASAIPPELIDKIKHLRGSFERTMRDLYEAREEPYYAEAIALAEQHFEHWRDDARHLTHYSTLNHIVHPHGKLIRATNVLFEDLVKLMDAPRDAPIPLDALRTIVLTDLRMPDDHTEDPARLQRFTRLEHLTIQRLTETPEIFAQLAALRFPPTLRSFTLDRLVPLDTMAPLLDHLVEDCPDLETFTFLPLGQVEDKARDKIFALIAGLPKRVSFKLLTFSSVWGDDQKFKRLFAHLDKHFVGRVHAMEVSDCKKDEGFPVLTPMGQSKVVKGLRQLTIDSTQPGGLEALFSNDGWNLDTLTVRLLYSANMRFHRKKHTDITFSVHDIEHLCISGALEGICELNMSGVIGHYNAPFMAEAIAAAPIQLRNLRLNLSHISNKGLKAFVDAGIMRDLNTLQIHEGKFKGKGLLPLMHPELGPQAPEFLYLTKNSMGKAIIQALADWEALKSVKLLDLTDVRITAENLAILHASPHLDRRAIAGQ